MGAAAVTHANTTTNCDWCRKQTSACVLFGLREGRRRVCLTPRHVRLHVREQQSGNVKQQLRCAGARHAAPASLARHVSAPHITLSFPPLRSRASRAGHAQRAHAHALMADEVEAAAPGASFSSLPHALAVLVFARLPVDARARCAAVCRGWAATLADVSLWTRLDLSDSSGVTCTVNDAALHGAYQGWRAAAWRRWTHRTARRSRMTR
jgi:hypothetical protein